jgi:AraC family transcriptional regulator of arabinose operon
MTDAPVAVAVTRLGIDVTHHPGFTIDRTNGSGDYLLVQFLAPILLRDIDGISLRKSGSCIIYAPGFPQWYRVSALGFSHHWLHASGPGMEPLLATYGLPINRVFVPIGMKDMSDLLEVIQRNLLVRPPFGEREVGIQVERLMLAWGRGLAAAGTSRPMVQAEAAVRRVRQELFAHLEAPWTLAELVRRSGLGRARFVARYVDLFGLSPIEDLIRARIDKARWILGMGERTVAEVAEAVGFRDVPHFSRTFRRRVGCAPSRYWHRQTVHW